MPRSRVSEILCGKRAITADTATRLASFFRMRPEFWMSLQATWDLERAPPAVGIVPLDPPGFLVGPDGATPIQHRPEPRPRYVPVPTREAPAPDGEIVHEEVRYPDGTRALVSRRG